MKRCVEIATHAVTNQYSKHMGPIDRADRDMADWGISEKSHYEYNRMVDWLLDANGSNDFRIATYHEPAKRAAEFMQYTGNTTNMRYAFQLDKSLEMTRLGVERECPDLKGKQPGWMRQHRSWIPCGCRKCVFCLKGATNGVGNAPHQVRNKRRRKSGASVSPKKDCSKHVAATGTCGLCYTRKKQARENNGASDVDTAKLRRSRNKATTKCRGCSKLMCGLCAAEHFNQALEGPG